MAIEGTDTVSTIATLVDHHVGFHFSSISHLRFGRPPRCSSLHVHYAFPSDFIVDPYELELYSKAFTYELYPQPDLEQPVFAASPLATTLKLTITPTAFDAGQPSFNVTVPVHARYGRPSMLLSPDEAYEVLRFPQPNAFWQCTYPDGVQFKEHFWLNATTPEVTVLVPLGVTRDGDFVEFGTVAVISSVFIYLLWVFATTARRVVPFTLKNKTD